MTSVISADALADLPSTENVFGILKTTQAPLVSDRFSKGLNPAEAARIGAFLDSWTQTRYRIGDVDITSVRGGVPMLVPQAQMWDRISVTSGFVAADATSGGVVVGLDPRAPSGPLAVSGLFRGIASRAGDGTG
jgi:hypothetical protein